MALTSEAALGDQALVAPSTQVHRRRPGPAESRPREAKRRQRSQEVGLAIGVPILLVTVWQLASSRSWIDSRLYPSPTDAWHEAQRLWRTGILWDAIFISGKRALSGFVIGAVVGVLLGFGMSMSRLSRAAFEPLFSALYTVPKLALLPVFLTIFGFGEMAIYMLIAVTVFFFVWIATMTAVMSVPAGYREAAMTFDANRRQMIWHVLLPGALPQIFVGFRIAAGVSVLMLVGVEFVVANEGLGYLINQGRTLMLNGQSYACIVIVAVLGYAFSLAIRLTGRVLLPWSAGDNGVPQG